MDMAYQNMHVFVFLLPTCNFRIYTKYKCYLYCLKIHMPNYCYYFIEEKNLKYECLKS